MRSGTVTTASQALAQLEEGNARFVSGCSRYLHNDAMRRRETCQHGQHPFVSILSCSDSRVPVEIVFDQGIGDIFVVRVPGNVCNADEIGAIEYGVGHLETPLCVVLGHTQCGAVTSVVTGAELHGHLAQLVGNIRHAVAQASKENPTLDRTALIGPATRANVLQSMRDLTQGSALVHERIKRGSLKLVGAIYDLATGEVAWLED